MPRCCCVECGKKLDGAINADRGSRIRPKPGDFTLCIYCGSLNTFDEQLRLRQPTVDEYVESTHYAVLQRARVLINSMNARREEERRKSTENDEPLISAVFRYFPS